MNSTRVADRYVLDREIGRGGAGAVWLARDEVLGRVVALKRLGLPAGASAFDLARAEREARLAARVNHPNVVAVFDFLAAEEHWLVMEYVDGTTLARMIREHGPLPPDRAAELLVQAADALAAAHGHGVVHRDVKPSNILVGRNGDVKLSDFGIARALADASLTQTGLVTGSPAYLSPEVATGSGTTPASDTWSFGATLFHALAGQPPYQVDGGGSAVLGVLYQIAHEAPPRLRNAGWLGPLLEATMTHAPEQRPTMSDVAAYLRARPTSTGAAPALPAAAPAPTTSGPGASVDQAPDAVTTGRRWRAGLVGVGLVALFAVVGALLLFLDRGGPPDDAAAPASSQQDDSGQDTTDPDGSEESTDATEPTEPTDGRTPTADELTDFATSYVETASSDPTAGFAMLTPGYQSQSSAYEDFWGPMSNPEVLDIEADPDQMTVTYTYRYDWTDGSNRTEQVTLFLVEQDGRLLIANATAG